MKLSGISKLKKLIAVISLPFDEDFNKPKLYNEKKKTALRSPTILSYSMITLYEDTMCKKELKTIELKLGK